MPTAPATKPALEFKGRMTTLTILRLLEPSVEVLARELDRHVQQAPGLFQGLPVILDVGEVASSDLHMDLPGLAAHLRSRHLIPIGVRGSDARWVEAAETAGLPIFPEESDSAARSDPSPKANGEPEAGACGLVITEPVRSGQQVYARGGDLVVIAAVSPGAELLADGHIHVYGALSGRALAGVQGDTSARIICRSFHAALVSVAGTYSISDQFDEELSGMPVQTFLQQGTLRIERL
ncbi:MAG: septum site-determining protein MinC [Halofilum sp. (in: g-proteobacteria)]